MWHYSGALLHEKAFAGGSWLLKIGITTSAELLLIYVNCKVKKKLLQSAAIFIIECVFCIYFHTVLSVLNSVATPGSNYPLIDLNDENIEQFLAISKINLQ